MNVTNGQLRGLPRILCRNESALRLLGFGLRSTIFDP